MSAALADNSIHSSMRPLVGTSPRLQQVLEQIERIRNERWPVLILGETGTGKELIAKTIHSSSTQGPFVVVDCSALVGPLMESELFGHAKGSFTGAVGSKVGLIELADGGTAFLDEIGELPLEMQSKLLRVLQEKEFRPVGALHTRRSDFRIVSATNRDLAAEVEKGTFRRDLFYRLKVVTLRIPPLRDRREDIPELVRFFLHRYGCRLTVTPEAMEVLTSYGWPGNVRELENCVQHMVAVTSGALIHLHDLPSPLLNFARMGRPQMAAMAAAIGRSVAGPSLYPAAEAEEGPIIPLLELERREILRAIKYTKGDRTVAASLLGIGRTTLYRKLKEYGFD
jgi:DNA-binding NtrC family response regulator